MTIGPVVLLGLLSIFFMLTTDGTQFHDGGNRRRTEGNCCGNAGSV